MQVIKKERIKDRMVKTAARVWGVAENEIESNFDPLILLMIDACSAELEKIGYDINASQARLLDRLADLILPEALLGPKPASSVMQASPSDGTAKLLSNTQFYTNQKIQRPEGSSYNTDIFFTPIAEFTIHKVDLKNLLIGQKLYSINENNSRTPVNRSESGDASSVQEIWLALSPDKAAQSLKGLSIYFDMRSHSEANNFYKSLENATASIAGTDIALTPGYFRKEQLELTPEEMLISGHDYTKKLGRRIASIYQRQFVHIATDKPLSEFSTSLPEEWKASLPETVLKPLAAEPRLYIKITLSRPFPAEVLEGLTCSINAFPVMNRKFNTLNYRTDTWVNIIPMQIEGSFLDLHDITGSSGGKYKFRTGSEKQGLEEGEASVRSSGIGKTDSREVREIIGSLTEAIRDESAYFSELSNEFILARLREVSQILARLEDQLAAAKDSRSPHHYVLLRPKQAGDQVTITYWTTNAEDANKVKAGSAMTAFNHTLVNPKSALMLSNTMGGVSGVTEVEKKLLLKQQLISKGKIISAEDIRLLCFQLFGSKLKQAEVKKGVQIGTTKEDGFIRTIDIHLTLAPEAKDGMKEEVGYLCNALEYQLAQNAAPIYPFRIILN